jgi:hypothetical protein
MADNRLDRARKLLQNPSLTDEDRDTLLSQFPDLDLADPVPVTEPIPQQVSVQQPMEEPLLGSAVGIQTQEIPAVKPLSGIPKDVSYSSLMKRDQSKQLDDADYQPDNPGIRNATKRASLYAGGEESINPDNPQTYYHLEPTVDEVRSWAARTGNEKALETLDNEGEDSDIYKQYSDVQWRKVRDAFSKTGEGAIRIAHLDPETAMQWYDKINGFMQSKAASFLGGYDDSLMFGLGKQGMASVHQPFAAEQELVKLGVIRPFAERLESMQSESPGLSIAGSAMGYMNPASLARGVTRAVTKGASKVGEKAAKYAAPFIEAGLSGGAIETARKLGAEARREESIPWSDVGLGAAVSSAFGGLMGGAAEMLGLGGAARTKSLRAKPATREQLARLEMGSPEMRGGTTAKPFTGGVRPGKRYAETAEELAGERALATKEGLPAPAPKSPTAKMAEDVEWPMRQELSSFRTETKKKIAAMKEPYYQATEGERRSVGPVGKRILEMIGEGKSAGWELPWAKNKVLEDAVGGLGHRVKHLDGTESWKWRDLNPREFDRATRNLDDMLNEEANKTATKKLPSQLSEIQKLMRELRDAYPVNAHAPPEMVETVMIGGRPTEIRGGLSALNARGHKLMNKVRNAGKAMGLKSADRIEPDMMEQKEAVIKRAREWGLENKSVSDDVLRRLFKGRPDLIQELDSIGSGEAYETFQRGIGGTGMSFRGAGGSPGMSASTPIDRITGVYSDPFFMMLSKLEGKGGAVGTVSGIREKDISVAPAAHQALRSVSTVTDTAMDGMELLHKLYKQASDRGILNDLRKSKEIK